MKNLFLFLLSFSIYVGFFDNPAYAQKIVNDLKKPMPQLDLMEVEEYQKSSTLYEEKPFNDDSLAYSVRLPKKWSKPFNQSLSNFSLSNKVLGEIDRFYGPARMGERSYFSVKAVELEYKLTAEQWFIIYMLENGYTMEGIKAIDNDRVEVIYVLIDGDVTYIATAVAQITGSRVVFAQYVVPADAWKENSNISRRVIESFKLKTLSEEFVEKMTPYQFLDIAEIKYPESWELRAKPLRSADRMSVSLLNVDSMNEYSNTKVLKGKMEVHLATEFVVDDIDIEISDFIDKMSSGDLAIQDVLEDRDDFTVDENMDVVQIKTYNANDRSQNSENYEYWLAVLHSGEYYYFLSMLTLSRDVSYVNWVRNTQTFRLLVESTKPLVE